MSRLMNSIADTITATLGNCRSGKAVVILATLRLTALRFARCLLAWLTEWHWRDASGTVPVGSQVVVAGHMQPAVAVGGAAHVRRHYLLRTLRPCRRRLEPGCGASLGEF
jgi:hypothetical protein